MKSILPQANHLLGYAENKGPSWFKIGLIVIPALVLAGTVLFGAYAAVGRVPEVTGKSVTLTVRGKTNFPEFLPLIWRTAVEASNLPVTVGSIVGENGITQFAIVPRWTSLDFQYRQDVGIFSVYSDEGPVEISGDSSVSRIARSLIALVNNPGYLEVDIAQLTGTDANTISGPITVQGWQTDFVISHSPGAENSDGDVYFDATAFPEAWPMINQALRSATNIEIDEMPSSISYKLEDGRPEDVTLTFSEAPADETLYKLAGSVGLYDIAPYSLPDGTTVLELKLPRQKLDRTRVEADPESWKRLALKERNLVNMGTKALVEAQGCATGRLIFKLSEKALDGIARGLDGDIELHEQDGKMTACFK